jgi:hypothetical protein
MSQGFKLLTPGNPKTEKGRGAGYWTFILHLSPAKLSGYNVCPMATKGCKAACLNTAGRGGIMAGHGILTAADVAKGIHNTIQKARIRRTKLFFEARETFMTLLAADIRRGIAKARKQGYEPVFRLNGTSDIRWESIAVEGASNIFALFPGVQFYDYTKIANRKNIPANYAITFSLADGNDAQAAAAMRSGINVAAVFRNKASVAGHVTVGYELEGARHPVFTGDDTDLRFLDPAGVIVALYAKGNAKRDRAGFVRD